ncbi:MAG TPA: hypothetical protein VGD17_02215 [Chitinophagaceae bacterium]
MKKWLIGSLVGAVLLFAWQFLSWGVTGLHDNEFKYHPQQDQIISALSANLKEDGRYMIPRPAPDVSSEEYQKVMSEMFGKPSAIITYKSSLENKMASQMIRGFLIDIVIVLLLIYLMGGRVDKSLGSIYMATLAVGFVAWLWHPYTEHNWFQSPVTIITGALLEWIIAYSILGLWIGFWLSRNYKPTVNRP